MDVQHHLHEGVSFSLFSVYPFCFWNGYTYCGKFYKLKDICTIAIKSRHWKITFIKNNNNNKLRSHPPNLIPNAISLLQGLNLLHVKQEWASVVKKNPSFYNLVSGFFQLLVTNYHCKKFLRQGTLENAVRNVIWTKQLILRHTSFLLL